jgi:hypothetical protein
MSSEMKRATFVKLVFEHGFDERDEYEAENRGYRSHVWVELDDGSHHLLTFYDVTRLSQTLEDECSSGRMFFAEPGLVVVPAVTRANMEAAAKTLASEGFFSKRMFPTILRQTVDSNTASRG